MRRLTRTLALPGPGLALVLIGFLYDLRFAGIPYQDPTPELQARWELHKHVAGLFYMTGGVLLLLGLLAIPVVQAMRAKKDGDLPD